MPKLSLIIPVYNEVGNIIPLVESLIQSRKEGGCPDELVLVDNGSQDNSANELTEATRGFDWIKVIPLNPNDGYGGGIQAGLKAASCESTHLGWIPADRQYSIADLNKVWKATIEKPHSFHKGLRTTRLDGEQTKFISMVYTGLVKSILNIGIEDVNGLPKIFPKSFYEQIDFPLAKSFHLDCQLLVAARKKRIPISEHPVTFYARREGVSSWSSKKIQVYLETLKALFRIRIESKGWFENKCAD